MKPAYTIGLLAGVESEHTHGEAFVGVGILTTHVHEIRPRNTKTRREFTHIFAEETFVEIVMTGGNGSVDCVERSRAHDFQCGIEVKSLFLNIVHQTLQIEKSRMAFVAVVEIGVDAELLQHQHAAYAKQIFLFYTVLPVATVKLVGDRAVIFAVEVEIRIHEVELHAAYVHTPDVRVDDASGIWHLKYYGLALLVGHLLDGKLVEVLGLVVCYLLAIDRQSLGEISVTVKEADGCHVNATVGSFLYIIAGKNTKTAGIDLQTVAQTIFHREI